MSKCRKLTAGSIIIPGEKIKRIEKEEINCSNKSKFFLVRPGSNVLKLNFNLDGLGVQHEHFENLIPPATFAFLNKCKHSFINIKTFVCIKKEKGIKEHDFALKYQVVLNDVGNYQLNIYITFDAPHAKGRKYKYYDFDIVFKEKAIKIDTKPNSGIIPIYEIDTVKVFLIKKNPKTSRGTVTTVQNQTSHG